MKNTRNILFGRSSEDDEDFGVNEKFISMFRETRTVDSVDIYLDEPIREVSYYRTMLHYLRSMKEEDEARIWIDGPGGMLDTTLAIIDAIRNSRGRVISIVSGQASSAHSMIALSSPSLVLGDNARFFLHAATYGYKGKQQEVESFFRHQIDYLRKVVQDSYGGFLTSEEIDRMLEGKDYYFVGEELEERVRNRYEYLDEISRDNTEEAEKAKNTKRKAKMKTYN